jgi:hypothetical protein
LESWCVGLMLLVGLWWSRLRFPVWLNRMGGWTFVICRLRLLHFPCSRFTFGLEYIDHTIDDVFLKLTKWIKTGLTPQNIPGIAFYSFLIETTSLTGKRRRRV